MMSMLVECNGKQLRDQKAYTASFNTRHGWVGSRLDRFYSSDTLQPFIQTVRVLHHIAHSDHKPVLMELRGRLFEKTLKYHSPKIPRVKMSFRTDQNMIALARAEFSQWIATSSDQLREDKIIANWANVKRKMVVISNWYSSKLEKEIKQNLAHLSLQQNDQVAKHHEKVLQRQLAQANQAEPKLIIQNDQIDNTFHKFLKGKKHKENIPPLTHPNGATSRSQQGNAEILIQQYAQVSRKPDTKVHIQDEILAFIPESDKSIFSEYTSSDAITPSEVMKALKQMNKCAAPGHDGIRLPIYYAFRQQLAPILATLYTQMINTRTVPRNFLDGLIKPIPKGPISCDPSQYRPITLLNVDYRIWTFILKNRITQAMQKLIPETQTAFLPGRLSAQNIWIQQSVPALLQAEKKWCLVALCDFQKAYDTVDRNVLLKLCRTLSMPTFIHDWITLMLHETKSRVLTGNCLSSYRVFYSGIRQGCPASPQLYLLIGYLLKLLIDQANIGIVLHCPYQIPQTRQGTIYMDQMRPQKVLLNLNQFADDSKIYLASAAQVKIFKEVMDQFACVTNQQLNHQKTKLIPIGDIPIRYHRVLKISNW